MQAVKGGFRFEMPAEVSSSLRWQCVLCVRQVVLAREVVSSFAILQSPKSKGVKFGLGTPIGSEKDFDLSVSGLTYANQALDASAHACSWICADSSHFLLLLFSPTESSLLLILPLQALQQLPLADRSLVASTPSLTSPVSLSSFPVIVCVPTRHSVSSLLFSLRTADLILLPSFLPYWSHDATLP